jgi:hypothetical protein
VNSHELLVFIHLLGWVFWLGTDVGVFLGAKAFERADLSVETRMKLLELGMVLDRFPRFSMPVVWLTGVLLMNDLGYTVIPAALAAIATLIWLVVTWLLVFQPPGSPVYIRAAIAQLVILLAVILGMGGYATLGLSSGELPLWLALKWYAFVLVAITVLALEKKFAPLGPLLGELMEHGASDDLNGRISAVLKPVYPIVLAIYLWTLLAAASGVSKVIA